MSQTILIVEDEVAIAENLCYALATDGFVPQHVSLGQDALDLLQTSATSTAPTRPVSEAQTIPKGSSSSRSSRTFPWFVVPRTSVAFIVVPPAPAARRSAWVARQA